MRLCIVYLLSVCYARTPPKRINSPNNPFNYVESFKRQKRMSMTLAPEPLVKEIYTYLAYAALAYCETAIRSKSKLLTLHKKINDPLTQTHAQIYINKKDMEIIVAFRGSHNFFKIKDAYDDTKDKLANVSGPLVNRNAQVYALSIQRPLTEAIARLRRSKPGYRIVLVGHSLGGSLATLMAPILANATKIPIPKFRIFTFGQPRVGDQAFVDYFNNLHFNFTRVVNKDDPVPDHPSSSKGWAHVHQEVYIDDDNLFYLCHNEHLQCSFRKSNTLAFFYSHSKLANITINSKSRQYHLSKFLTCQPTH
ncbi:hypothetical protein DSO57_1028344 [Entomophthora muscae]|uniref:Uncharacterized protein n=1 Tax=Entomophthora muscae TaxID=34485 RepID=A0ACC2UBK0_9FUNG|nr:hypothetical protein DSO57_1028344 [Entomophthora muscae]